MKSSRSSSHTYRYNHPVKRQNRLLISFLLIAFLVVSAANYLLLRNQMSGWLNDGFAFPWSKAISLGHTSPQVEGANDSTPSNSTSATTKKSTKQSRSSVVLPPSLAGLIFSHVNITTTIFWAGEGATAANGFIPNSASAWDEQWATHYGGIDSPSPRNGYYPAGFTPKENPFYFALPYSDFTNDGKRKTSANSCPGIGNPVLEKHSWCKNAWIIVRHGNKVAFAQWQDVGPYEEDDTAYVFGSSAPKNKQGAKAGLDVSPAVKDYLGLDDVSKCDWAFITAGQVPDGPWKQIVTVSPGESF